MRRLFIVVAALIALRNLASCDQSKPIAKTRPTPPSGYSWVTIDRANAAFLLPENWHYQSFRTENLLKLWISPDEIETGVAPVRGMEVQVGLPPKEMANATINVLMERRVKADPAGQINEVRLGDWKGRSFIGKYEDSPSEQKMTYYAAIASQKTGTFFVITFFTPLGEWDTLWPTGRIIAKQFILGDMPAYDGVR